jgi:hypothetical protein
MKKILRQANIFDDLGFYKEADKIDKLILSQNFQLKKKKISPYKKITDDLNYLKLRVNEMPQEIAELTPDESSVEKKSTTENE